MGYDRVDKPTERYTCQERPQIFGTAFTDQKRERLNRKISHFKVSTPNEHAYIVDGAKSIVVIENCIVVIENCMMGRKLTLRPYVYKLAYPLATVLPYLCWCLS